MSPEPSFSSPTQPDLPIISQKGRLIRLESEVQAELISLCQAQGLTLELFVEAAFVQLQKNEKWLSRVLNEAQKRKERRKQAAMIRRARTLSQKYSPEI